MAYDTETTDRIREVLSDQDGITEQKMFGGLCFLDRGNMCCGVARGRVVLRLGREDASAALEEDHTSPMDFTGKVIRTMVYLESSGYERDAELRRWVMRALAFTNTLEAKV